MKIIFTMALFFSMNVIAGTQLDPQMIKSIGMGWVGEGLYVTTYENLDAGDDCGIVRAKMDSSHKLFKENLSVLLSAFHASEKVRLYVDGCDGVSMKLMAVSVEKE